MTKKNSKKPGTTIDRAKPRPAKPTNEKPPESREAPALLMKRFRL